MNNAPCKGCSDRFIRKEDGKTITCHMVCEKYISFRTDKNEEIRSRTADSDYHGLKHDIISRVERARRRKNG